MTGNRNGKEALGLTEGSGQQKQQLFVAGETVQKVAVSAVLGCSGCVRRTGNSSSLARLSLKTSKEMCEHARRAEAVVCCGRQLPGLLLTPDGLGIRVLPILPNDF